MCDLGRMMYKLGRADEANGWHDREESSGGKGGKKSFEGCFRP